MINAKITIVNKYNNEYKVLDKDFENNRQCDNYISWLVRSGTKIVGVETKYKPSVAEELLAKAAAQLDAASELSKEITIYLKSKEIQSYDIHE
jgi:DNA-binding sugar fermentation-stimulating protein